MAGNLIIVSAPSGAGKTTLVERMLKRVSGVRSSISMTARPPRPGEEDGHHYHFVSPADFQAMIARGEFLEWAEVHGNLYGTSRRIVDEHREAGFDVVLTIDVQGARTARVLFPDSISVFILPPSREVLEARLRSRGENHDDDLCLRLQNASHETAEYKHFDYIIINDELESATEELVAIILARRCARERRAPLAEAILTEFA
ncbi:MAG: guanylate kinase [Acidobacteriota bacterium]